MIYIVLIILVFYVSYILKRLFYTVKSFPTLAVKNQLSIVIPSSNFSADSFHLLNGLTKTSHELIVVLNGVGNTKIENLTRQYPKVNFYTLSEPNKKKAVELGVAMASNKIILQIDDDIRLWNSTLNRIEQLELNENTVYQLPVLIHSYPKYAGVFKVEDRMLLALTMLQNSNEQILAYGAGLLYAKDLFLKLNPFENNRHINSGDDMFLVHQAKQNAQVVSLTNHEFILESNAPSTIKKLSRQRIRWASKNSHFKDGHFYMLLFLQVFLGIVTPILGLVFLSLDAKFAVVLLLIYLVKSAFDVFMCQKINRVLRLNSTLSALEILQTILLYPFSSLIIGTCGMFKSLKKHVI